MYTSKRSFYVFTALCIAAFAVNTALAAPLTVLSGNTRYPDDGSGKGVMLTGSHVWGNIQDDTQAGTGESITWSDFLDYIVDNDHSFVRGWCWEDAYYTKKTW